MRKVVGLRLPTMAGTQGESRPSSKKWTICTGMKAWRASVRSGSWVEKKFGSQDDQVEEDQQAGAGHRQVMAAEAPPHQPPVGGDGDAVFGFLACDGGDCPSSYFSTRMRGSISASRTSDSSVPTMVRNE